MNLINLVTLDYPRSLWQLRQENSNVSFPAEPTDDDLLPFDHANVHPTPPPACDPRTERVEDTLKPQQADDGTWQQVWSVRPATVEEIAAWDAVHAPPPRWFEFSTSLMTDAGANAMLGAVLAVAPGIYSGLSVGLNEASRGDTRLLLSAWSGVQQLGLLTADFVRDVQEKARAHNLPADFIAALELAEEPTSTPDKPRP